MVEESWISRLIHGPMNSTFIVIIPKQDHPSYFDDVRPISACNVLYKIISKIIARRLKRILSKTISSEKFGFLEGRKIHEAIGVSWEGLHSTNTHKIRGVVVKIDLSKAYDMVNILYI